MTIDEAFNELKGQVISDAFYDSDGFTIVTLSGKYRFYHQQDCCEGVWLEDVIGDVDSLKGQRIYDLRTVCSQEENANTLQVTQWTFMVLVCSREDVTFRWCGTSNGFYSMGPNMVSKNGR